MSSSSSQSSKNRRSSILKVRQTTIDTKVDVVELPKNQRRVSFHHQKAVKEYDKEKHELSATSPIKEAVKEAMSDFDSTKSNSTMMSLSTPDRTTGDNNTMMLFRGMMSGGHPSSIHQETKDMSFSILEDPANPNGGHDDTLNIFNGKSTGHVSIHTETVDISYRMEESAIENAGDDTMNIFRKPSMSQSTPTVPTTSNIDINKTMDMDISRVDNTLTEGGSEGDDTMAVFGIGNKKNDITILDNTMDVFTACGGSSEKSCLSQSILMDITAKNPSPPSSQDQTIAIFGKGSQSNESVMMDESTVVDEDKEEKKEVAVKRNPPNILAHTPLDSESKTPNESRSPDPDDTMAVFTFGKTQKVGDYDVQMDISMAAPRSNEPCSPTMNIFKRKGGEDNENDDTINVFASKRWREEGDACAVEEKGSQEMKEDTHHSLHPPQKSGLMDDAEETMNVFGSKSNESVMMDGSAIVDEDKEEKEDDSVLDLSTKRAVEGSSENTGATRSDSERTMNVFDGVGEISQMDLTGMDGANATFEVIKSGGDSSQMDITGDGSETLAIFGKKEEEEEEEHDKTLEEDEKEDVDIREKSIQETQPSNQSMVSIHSENGSEDMMDVTPLVSQSPRGGERMKTRLSTVIEVSSRYTAASSQSMRQRVESTGDESKEGGILDRMEEDGKEEKADEDKSVRMDDESMGQSSPFGNNTFSTSLTKRNMLDETRLSDRSMMNVTRSFEELALEKIAWMRKEGKEGKDGNEMDALIEKHATPFVADTNEAIERSESSVEALLPQIIQAGHSDLLTKSIMKMNASKVQEYRLLFEWARREAQREWWEKRAEKANAVNEEMEKIMKRDEDELKTAKDDFILMNRHNEIKEDVDSLMKEVELGRGLSRNTIDELINASKKKEEEKEKLEREMAKLELENVRQSTMTLKIMAERCTAVDESIRRKMEERERNKRELRNLLNQLTNNLN